MDDLFTVWQNELYVITMTNQSSSPSTSAGAKVGWRLDIIMTLSLTIRTPNLWRRWRTTSSSSFPRFLASCLPSLVMVARPTLCQPPKVSTARGRKVIASALHLSSYFLSLVLWACSTAISPSSEDFSTRACWRGLTTVMSSAVSRPSVQMGMRTSAGRSSEPGRRPSGSLTGPSPALIEFGCIFFYYFHFSHSGEEPISGPQPLWSQKAFGLPHWRKTTSVYTQFGKLCTFSDYFILF